MVLKEEPPRTVILFLCTKFPLTRRSFKPRASCACIIASLTKPSFSDLMFLINSSSCLRSSRNTRPASVSSSTRPRPHSPESTRRTKRSLSRRKRAFWSFNART